MAGRANMGGFQQEGDSVEGAEGITFGQLESGLSLTAMALCTFYI